MLLGKEYLPTITINKLSKSTMIWKAYARMDVVRVPTIMRTEIAPSEIAFYVRAREVYDIGQVNSTEQ